MQIKLNNGLIIDSSKIVEAYIDPYYNLESEAVYARTKDVRSSRTQRRVTTHALGHECNICILILLADAESNGEISDYYTEYHPDIETAEKRIHELVYET